MKKLAFLIAGVLLLLLGLISLVTPIPGSAFFTASGLTILICSSPWFRACVRMGRKRFKFFHKVMTWLENHTGKSIGEMLKTSHPDADPNIKHGPGA